MAYASCDQYGKAEVCVDSVGMIKLSVKDASIHMSPQEAARVRDALSLTITEAAQKAAQAVEAEGAQA